MSNSATWPPGVRRLAESYMKDPFQVNVGTLDLRVSLIVKYSVLNYILIVKVILIYYLCMDLWFHPSLVSFVFCIIIHTMVFFFITHIFMYT